MGYFNGHQGQGFRGDAFSEDGQTFPIIMSCRMDPRHGAAGLEVESLIFTPNFLF